MTTPIRGRQPEESDKCPPRRVWLRTPDAIDALLAAESMSSVYDKAAFAQAVRQEDLHLLGLRKRHWIEMRVQPRHEMLAAALHDTRRLDTVLVVVESLLRQQSSHAHVVRSFTIALRVAKKDDVHVVMILAISSRSFDRARRVRLVR